MTKTNETCRFSIKYDGDKHSIDALTYLTSLLSITTALQQINSELNKDSGSQQKIDILINANKEGSFVVDLALKAEAVKDALAPLFTTGAITYCQNLLKLLSDIINLKKHLKGDKPKVIEDKALDNGKIQIADNNGNIYITENATFNIYNRNPMVRETISKAFTALANDDSVTSIAITDETNKELVAIDSKEFDKLIPENDCEQTDLTSQTIVDSTARINIVKLGFEESYKWDFYYNGYKISARMADKGFYDKIDMGEQFAKGDTLIAELEIAQEFDKSVNAFVNKNYAVKKILKHIPRHKQTNLFQDEDSNTAE